MRLKFLFLLLWVGLSQASAEERITIGVGPWFDDQTMTEGYQHFIRYMESTIGVSVEFHVAKDYHDLVNKIAHQRVDIGFFAPASYVEAKAEIPGLYYLATVVYRNKKGELTDHYSSYIVVHKDSGYQSLEDLRDKRFAFTEFHSTSGYLYPTLYLQQKGINPEHYFSQLFMLKRHSKVCAAIAKKRVDAGATYDDA